MADRVKTMSLAYTSSDHLLTSSRSVTPVNAMKTKKKMYSAEESAEPLDMVFLMFLSEGKTA